MINKRNSGAIFIFFLTPAMGILGVLAKENAALLPLYIAAIETTLFRNERPWHFWDRLSKRSKLIILSLVTLAVIVACYWIIDITQAAYRQRSLSVGERVMTEARVLVFYISQILIPQINGFGLHHDDIAISDSLISPWTTLPSIIFLIAFLFLAFRYRSRLPLFSLGIFLFITAHLLESTIYPLDIAYEHRNYFASFGIVLAIGQLIALLGKYIDRRVVLVIASTYIILFASVTFLIAKNWETDISLYTAELRNHPNSAILNFEYAGLLENYRRHDEAVTFAAKAVSLKPDNIAFRIFLALLQSKNNFPLDKENTVITADLLKSGTITPTASLLLSRVITCIANECSSLIPAAERWTAVLAVRKNHPRKLGQYNHMHGVVKYYQHDILSAQNSILKAIEIYPGDKSAYIDLAAIYAQSNQTDKAIRIYQSLIKIDADRASLYRQKIETLSIPGKK
jgi:tetratricopeptide (TPR) repeat protein